MRTLVDIPEGQIRELTTLCVEKHISRAEAVRQAIAAFLSENAPQPKMNGFGLWSESTVDGLEYQEKMRSEWDR